MGLAEVAARVNWVDLLIVILLIKISYDGFRRGFSSEVVPFLGIFSTILVSLHNYYFVGQFIDTLTPLSRPISNLISLSLLTVIVLLFFIWLKNIIMRLVKLEVVSFLDRLGGAILGALRASLSISLILVIFVLVPLGYFDSSIKNRSLMGMGFLLVGPRVYDRLVKYSPGGGSDEGTSMAVRFRRQHWR